MLNRSIRLVPLLSFLLASSVSAAVPKSTPCKVYKTDMCVKKELIKKSFRNALPKSSKFLTPLQTYPATLHGFPKDETPDATPLILIPAGVETQTVCLFTRAGKFECTVLSVFKPCPRQFTFQDENGGLFTCDVDCDNRRANGDADANGNCDCDIDYSTCRAGTN